MMLVAISRSYFGNLLQAHRTPEGICCSFHRPLHHLALARRNCPPICGSSSEFWPCLSAAPVLAGVMAQASDGPPAGYRPNVGLCLINSENKVFIARRVDLPDCWQMPQGGVEEYEDPRSAALRELKEETGVTSVEVIGEVPEWLTYDFPPDVKTKITQLWGKEWTGQAQKWFLCRFMGDEKEINLDGDALERPEFTDWKWTSPEDVLLKAVDFKRPVYEKVFKAFNSIFNSGKDAKGTFKYSDENTS